MGKRDWKEVNRKYIRRGEFFINPIFLDTWMNELKEMNYRKVGEPYLYPESMIDFTSYFHCKGFDYRGCEGILRGISNLFKIPFPVMSYSQICRRTNKKDTDFEDVEEKLVVGVDGSGEKVSNRGEWMREKWKSRRGWIKVVIMGYDKGIVDIRVGNENLNEGKAARGMIRKNRKKIKKVMMDGLHDCRATFNLCENYGIETAIKIRKGASTKPKNSPRRKREVIKYQSIGHAEWIKKTDYGKRWPMTEGHFSGCKRIFGEYVRATKKKNMYKEAKLKFWAYNNLLKV